jgi:cysteinyl-tRNA synthetase
MSEDKQYRNLVRLLKLFQNRPNHLAKYLIDNMAFNDLFLKLLVESEKLSDLEDNPVPTFKNIDEMHDYFNVFDESYKSKKKNPEKIIKDLTSKLEECLRLEKYEDAIRIRDYMIKLGYKTNE